MLTTREEQTKRMEELADEQGRRHALPEIRSMYPSKSRGEMSREFSQLFVLGYSAAMADAEKEITELKNQLNRNVQCPACAEVYSFANETYKTNLEQKAEKLVEAAEKSLTDYLCENCDLGDSWAHCTCFDQIKLRQEGAIELAEALSQWRKRGTE